MNLEFGNFYIVIFVDVFWLMYFILVVRLFLFGNFKKNLKIRIFNIKENLKNLG